MFVDKINILTKVFGNQETLEVFKDAESLGEGMKFVPILSLGPTEIFPSVR